MPAKIKKKTVPRHLVVVDTNVLFNPKEKNWAVVSPGFEAAWRDLAEFDLTLVVPHTVRGELLYRQTRSAIKAMKAATEHLATLSTLSARPYKHKGTEERVKDEVAARFDRWIEATGTHLECIPVTTIDWAVIIDSAVWRRPPFDEADDESKKEKGFRDALILETLKEICRREGALTEITFITNDPGLRAAAKQQIAGASDCLFYSSLGDLGSYLRLLKEDLDQEFIRTIQKRASAKFFTLGDPEALVIKDNIAQKIKNKFASKFERDPEPSGLFSLTRMELKAPTTAWDLASVPKILIGDEPQFEKLEKNRYYHWKNSVVFAQLFKHTPPRPPGYLASIYSPSSGPLDYSALSFQPHLAPSPMAEQRPDRIHVLEFAVKWKARVKIDGRFYESAFVDVDLVDEFFDEATDDALRLYRINEQP